MDKNVGGPERVGSALVGSMLLGLALRPTSSKAARILSGMSAATLLWRGASGSCAVYQKLGVNTATADMATAVVKKSILINKPMADVTQFLKSGSSGLQFVEGQGPGEFRSPGASGRWHLRLMPGNSNGTTRLIATGQVQAGDASLRKAYWQASRPLLSHGVLAELRNLKALIETGEIATTDGQSAGERGTLGALASGFMKTLHQQLEQASDLPVRPVPSHMRTASQSVVNAQTTGQAPSMAQGAAI